ncbi:predicted protein [Nematostella vectensis]|uniref:G-protein coupled receptors family 1 profile domain-containing protein n=1 Tax=Nematostella vectensis TaxID=45351 RepID=A7SH26_NEMVE|nr:melanocyte-stimulating hormone receptor [Nematostella vectensis]EDO36973.1 predicted protein [Nematostella vectensis]|eukprot:XP_001629036.1 predicted protein [Nematostella vectensis]
MSFNGCHPYSTWAKHGQINLTEFAIIAVLNGFAILPTIALNALVLVSIWRTPELHTPSMVLMGNLALSDFGVGAITQPALIIWAYVELYIEDSPRTLCYSSQAFGSIATVFAGVSLLSVSAVGFDRFLALHLHLRYSTIVTAKRTFAVCLSFWAFSLLVVLLWFTLGVSIYNFTVNGCIIALFGITIVRYLYIYKVIKRHQTQIHAEQSNLFSTDIKQYKKSVINSIVVYFVFAICSTPFVCALTYYEITKDNILSPKAFRLTVSLLLANSLVNPVIFCWKIKELRLAVWQIVMKLKISLIGNDK